MKYIFSSSSLLVFLLFLVLVRASTTSSKKSVRFDYFLVKKVKNNGEISGLLKQVEEMATGTVLLEQVRNYYKKDPNDSLITAYLVQHLCFDEILFFEEFLVIDNQVLEAFMKVCQCASEEQLQNLIFSFRALYSRQTLLLMASKAETYIGHLRVICSACSKTFARVFPEIKEQIPNTSDYLNILWSCIESFKIWGPFYETNEVRRKSLQSLVTEFLNCLPEITPKFKDAFKDLSVPTKGVFIEVAIINDNLDFVKFFISSGFFEPNKSLSHGVAFKGSALIFVTRNVQMLSELVAAGVELESVVLINHTRRFVLISMFTYLYLQGDAEMKAFLISREYKEQLYHAVAEDSVLFDLPELTKFALERCPEVEKYMAYYQAKVLDRKIQTDLAYNNEISRADDSTSSSEDTENEADEITSSVDNNENEADEITSSIDNNENEAN